VRGAAGSSANAQIDEPPPRPDPPIVFPDPSRTEVSRFLTGQEISGTFRSAGNRPTAWDFCRAGRLYTTIGSSTRTGRWRVGQAQTFAGNTWFVELRLTGSRPRRLSLSVHWITTPPFVLIDSVFASVKPSSRC
jgi:hypothetical protein